MQTTVQQELNLQYLTLTQWHTSTTQDGLATVTGVELQQMTFGDFFVDKTERDLLQISEENVICQQYVASLITEIMQVLSLLWSWDFKSMDTHFRI